MEDLKNKIISELTNYITTDSDNYLDFINGPGYEEPLFGFSSIFNPLFNVFKTVVGDIHLTPSEVYNKAYPNEILNNGTVISVALPLTEAIIKSNRKSTYWPSKEWTLARTYSDEILKDKITDRLVSIVENLGYQALVPTRQSFFSRLVNSEGAYSTWSERHVAYACGLGTFSLTDAMITEKGSAVRFISIITDLVIDTDQKQIKGHMDNCLFFTKGTCKACIKKCPIGAISEKGHDKLKCAQFLYGEESQQVASKLGAYPHAGSGCGLCQCGVPCERKNPNKTRITA